MQGESVAMIPIRFLVVWWYFHNVFQAFTYVWENHRDDADWFIKADDDTFVIMENLKWHMI